VLVGQVCALQAWDSEALPAQAAPPLEGAGPSQRRVLVLLQVAQADQAPQFPLTENNICYAKPTKVITVNNHMSPDRYKVDCMHGVILCLHEVFAKFSNLNFASIYSDKYFEIHCQSL
jgi:hypothetical protein